MARLVDMGVLHGPYRLGPDTHSLERFRQAFIDRRFYRSKYDASKTLMQFSSKLRHETDLDALSDELVAVVRETMQPEHVSFWLRPETSPKGEQAD